MQKNNRTINNLLLLLSGRQEEFGICACLQRQNLFMCFFMLPRNGGIFLGDREGGGTANEKERGKKDETKVEVLHYLLL